jgi:RNA polymerase sigma-70 factor (ECF subfamily)
VTGAPPEQALLPGAARGDPAAVRACIARYGPLVWSLARRALRDRTDAEDAVQEVFVDLWASSARYDPAKGSEPAFVAMIARRRIVDRLRRRRRTPEAIPLDEAADAPADAPDAERCAEAALAARVLEGLRPEQRRVLRLAVVEGLTHEEIAETTGTPLGTVKAHARRGLARIRKLLLGEEPGEEDAA